MLRKLMVLLAFLAVFGQSLAGASFLRVGSAALDHTIAHALEDAHHHHDDGGMHIDEVEEESFHVHLDGANGMALPGSYASRTGLALPEGPPFAETNALPSPPSDGLLRPPKHAS